MAYQQWQQSPQGIATLFSNDLPAAAQPAAQGLLDQQIAADQLYSKEQQRQYDFDMAADPMRLRGLDLGNQTAAAHLPGIQAQSEMLGRKNSNEALLNDDMIKDLKGKYSSEELKRHLADIEGLGTAALQHSQLALSNPLGAAQRWKEFLTKKGFGDLHNPAWDDNLDPVALSQNLAEMGKGLQGSSSALRQKMELLDAKNEALIRTHNIDAASRERVTDKLAAARERVAQLKQNTSKSAKNYEELAVRLEEEARQESNPEAKQELKNAAQVFAGEARSMKAASAIVTQSNAPDMGALGKGQGIVPRGQEQVNSAIRSAQPAASVPAAAPASAPASAPAGKSYGALPPPPQGRLYMRNVKTGQIGSVPEGQMEDAMKQGYELVR